MKKSKFLKKSLAMLLALMLVVAMIPLSASAADSEFVNDKVIVNIDAANGTLTKESAENTWTDALAYDQTSEKITVSLDSSADYDKVYYAVDAEDEEDYTEGTTISVPDLTSGSSKVVTFYAYDTETEAQSALYTVNVKVAAASTDTSIKSATLGDTAKIEGTVNNTAKTVTFTVPWNYDFSSKGTATLVMNNPTSETVTTTLTGTGTKNAQTVTVTSQQGNKTNYTVVAYEADCMSSLTIGGVAAVVDEKDASKYTVTLPAGTDTTEKLPVEFKATGAVKAKFAFDGSDTEITSGESYDFSKDINNERNLTFTDKKGNEKIYKVTVEVADSTDTAISGFTATVNGYTENGVVNGDKLSVVLPSTTTAEELKAVTVKFDVADGANVTVTGTAFDNDSNTTLDLTKPVVVTVTAQDNKTVAYYELSATVAEKANSNPQITSAKMTLNKVDYQGTISGTTITFTVPYSTANLTGATYSFAKTSATILSDTSSFTLAGPNTITATSDAGDKVTYTVKFEKAAAQTGKTLSSMKFYNATTEEKVTADNTYTASVSSSKVSVTLPYSIYKNNGSDAMTVEYALSEGAVLYVTDGAEKDDTVTAVAYKNGFDDEDGNTITVSELIALNEKCYVVADEFAASKISSGSTTVGDLNKGDLKGHCTVYTIEVKQADPATGATLSSLSATLESKGVTYPVTAAITGTTGVKVTVPNTMPADVFYFDYTASTYAKVEAVADGANVVLPTTYTAGSEATGAVKYDSTLKVYTGSDWKEIKAIRVTSEDGNTSNYYALTVEKAEVETGAVITSLKVNNQTATISGKTITVTLPFGSDLSNVTLTWNASKLAKVELSENPADTDEDGVDYYNLTDGMTITVTSEDTKTVNKYTLTATVAEQFSDVQPGAWYYDNVMAAVEAGIVSGKGDGTFAPMGNITRRDFAIMVTKLLLGGKEPAEATTTPFSDVASNDYALDYIAYCAENGIISGSDGQFRPGDYITRQEAASVMKNALELTGTTSELFADDAKIAGWAKANVYACKAAGIFNGDEKNNFNPTNTLTRAEAASIMVNALNK